MESLKAIMNKKKQELQGKATIDLGQVQRKKQQVARQEIQARQREKEQKLIEKLKQTDKFYQSRKKIKTEDTSKVLLPQPNIDESTQTPPLPKTQIIAKLRQLQQPITLFGQDDWSRYRRLRKCEQGAEKKQGTLNDEEFKKKLRDDEEYDELDAKFRNRLIEPRLMDDMTYRARKMRILDQDKNRQISIQQKCDEIMLWAKKVVRAWSENLEQIYNTEEKKKSNQGKQAISTYRLSCQHLEPLFKVLKIRAGDKDVINALYVLMNNAVIRDYTTANDKYIELSIGNAPWPMGVCMLGITVKRNAQRLAHILNDEMSRKWTQAIKRLLTISQQLYPNEDTTKMVLYSANKMM